MERAMSRQRRQKNRRRAGGRSVDPDTRKQVQSGVQKQAAVSPVHPDISFASPVDTTNETFPLRIQGIVLHALWKQQQPSPDVPLTMKDEIGVDRDETGLWTMLRLAWQPASDRADPPLLTQVQAEQAIVALFQHLETLYAPGSPGTTSSFSPPLYTILHIHTISVPRPGLYPIYGKKRKERTDAFRLEKQKIFIEHLQQLCRLTATSAVNEWLPNKFYHYDRIEHRQGWLILAPTHALLAEVGSEQVLILADQIQPIETDSTRLGILPEQYYSVLARIAQWVSNQDSFLAVDRLQGLIDSSEKSLDGQVLLNLALAAIGILIAFFPPGQNFQIAQGIALSCLVAASVAFWGYARWGYRLLPFTGWLCGLLALLSIFWTRLLPWFITLWSSVITHTLH
jgi:hypothetical protein